MALSHPSTLHKVVSRLVDELSSLGSIAGITCWEDDERLGTDAIQQVLAESSWHAVDLRADEAALQALPANNEPLVLVVKGGKPPVTLHSFLAAIIDGQSEVQLDAGESLRIPSGRPTFVCFFGAKSLQDVHPELRHIPYWETIDEVRHA